MGDNMRGDKCKKCGSNKVTEVINGGITQRVFYEGDYIVREETEYEKSEKYSKWFCTDCKAEF